MGEYPYNHGGLLDGGDDLPWNDRGALPGVGRQHAVKTDQMQARTRHQGGQVLHEFQRRHLDVCGAVAGIHGVHNEVIVDAIAQYPDRLRGIALINERITDAELDKLAAAGVRGFRANLHHKIGVQFDAAKRLAARVKRLGWHVQFLLDIEDFPDIDRVLGDYPVEVVIDHMGRPDTRWGTGAPGFQALLRLLQDGRAWAKLSGPYRKSAGGFPYADLNPFAHALVATAPDRLVWGTDWPHVMLDSPMPNDGDLCDLLAVWVPDAQVRSQILVDNPQRLYGF